jgi:hypothetical protein
MGIGLSLSRSIIEAHRWRLWAKANDGPGATFSFSIPSRSEGIRGARVSLHLSHHLVDREFSAFISAVKELLGPEQAQLSAVDWLDELEMDSRPESTSRDWRAVTIAASAPLANRLNAGPYDRSFAEDVD